MQHAAIIRRQWRRRLRTATPVRLPRRRSIRRVRFAGVSVLLFVLLSAPAGRAATGGHSGQQRPPGYLGIQFHDLTNDQAAALHLRDRRGVEVLLVDHDGPAASAGLEPHDLITGFNDRIVPSGEALGRMIRETGAGVEVKLSVFRDGSPITVRTKLANHEDLERKAWARLRQPDSGPPPPGADVSGTYAFGPVTPPPVVSHRSESFIGSMLHATSIGLMVEAMQPQLAGYFGAPNGQGLLVQSVEDGSSGAMAGVRAGDVILTADNQPMHTASDWSKHLRAMKGKPMTLDLLRDHREMSVTLQPGSKK